MRETGQIFSQTSLGAQEKSRMSACDSSPHCLDCDGAQVTFTPAAHGAQWRLHTPKKKKKKKKKARSPASWGVFSDAPMSGGDDRTHGLSPNATIFYDCAFPLSTTKDGAITIFSPELAQPPYRDGATLAKRPRSAQKRAGETFKETWKKKKKKNPGIAVSARLRVFLFFFSSSVSSSSGGPMCLTLERQQKTSSCYRPDVALWLATLRTQRTGILIGPIKSDPRPELCMRLLNVWKPDCWPLFLHNTTHLPQYHSGDSSQFPWPCIHCDIFIFLIEADSFCQNFLNLYSVNLLL